MLPTSCMPPPSSGQCTVSPLDLGQEYTFKLQFSNVDPMPLRGALCPKSVCVDVLMATVLAKGSSTTVPPTHPSSDLQNYILIVLLGLVIGAIGSHFFSSRRRRRAPRPGHPDPRGGRPQGQPTPATHTPIASTPFPVFPVTPPIIVRDPMGVPKSVRLVDLDVTFSGGPGVVVSAVDPVGFAEFADGITRRVALPEGVAIAPGATVRDIAGQDEPQGAIRG
jgi:hypothetical protein